MVNSPKKQLLVTLKLAHLEMWKILLEAQKDKPEDWRASWLEWFDEQQEKLNKQIKKYG